MENQQNIDKKPDCDKNDNKCETEGLGCINEFKCETSDIYPSYHYNGVYFTKMEWISAYKRRCKSQSNSNCAKPENLTEASEEEYCSTMNLYCRIDEKDKCVTRPENEIFCDKLLNDDDVSLSKDQVEYMYKLYQLGSIANLKSCLNAKKVDLSQNRWIPEYFFQSKTFDEEYKLVNCSDFQIILDNLNEIITNNNERNLINALKQELNDITFAKEHDIPQSTHIDQRIKRINEILDDPYIKNFKNETLFQTIQNVLIEIPTLRDPFIDMLGQCNLIGKLRIKDCEKENLANNTKIDCESKAHTRSDDYKRYRPTQFEVAYIITRLFYKFSTNDLLVNNIKEQALFHWLFNSFTKDRTWSQTIQLDSFTETKEVRKKNLLQSNINIYMKKLKINEYISNPNSDKISSTERGEIERVFSTLNESKYLNIDASIFENFGLSQNYTLIGSKELESDYFSKLCLELDLITTKNISELSVNVGYISKVLSLLESVPYSLLNVYRYVGSFWWQSKQYQYMLTVSIAIFKNATITTLIIPYLGDYGDNYILLVNFTHDILCILQSFGNSGAFLLTQGYSGWGDDIYSFLTALSIANIVDMGLNPLFSSADYIMQQKKEAKKNITKRTISPNVRGKVRNYPIFDKKTTKSSVSNIFSKIGTEKILPAIKNIFNFLIKAMEPFPETRAIQTILTKAFDVNNFKPGQLLGNLLYIIILILLTHWISQSTTCTHGAASVQDQFKDHIGSISQYPIKISKFALSCSSNSACTHTTSVTRAKVVLDQLHITNKSVIGLGKSFNELFKNVIGSITNIFENNGQKIVIFDSVSDCFSGLIQFFTNLARLMTEYIKNPNMTTWETYAYTIKQDNIAANWVYNPIMQMGSGAGSAWALFKDYCLENNLDPNSVYNMMLFQKLRGTFFFKVNAEGISDTLWGIGNGLLISLGSMREYVNLGGDNRRYTIKNKKQGKKRTINRKIHKNKSVKCKNKMRTKSTKYRKHNLLK